MTELKRNWVYSGRRDARSHKYGKERMNELAEKKVTAVFRSAHRGPESGGGHLRGGNTVLTRTGGARDGLVIFSSVERFPSRRRGAESLEGPNHNDACPLKWSTDNENPSTEASSSVKKRQGLLWRGELLEFGIIRKKERGRR